MLSFLRHSPVANRSATQGAMCAIWIDGVGCFRLSQKDRLTIGGPGTLSANPDDASESADLAILSDSQRRHATIVRTGEGYLLEAHGRAQVAGKHPTSSVETGQGFGR